LEAYHADHGLYPISSGPPDWLIVDHALTTPTAYLNSDLRDVFKSVRAAPMRHCFGFIAMELSLMWIAIALALVAFVTVTQMVIRTRDRHAESVSSAIVGQARLIVIVSTGLTALFTLFSPVGFFSGPDHLIQSNREWRDRPQGFFYWSDGESGWLLQSLGPDGEQILIDLSQLTAEGSCEERMIRLSPVSYDPTNGNASSGDIFRISGQTDPNRR
jgi:hypothetical protein